MLTLQLSEQMRKILYDEATANHSTQQACLLKRLKAQLEATTQTVAPDLLNNARAVRQLTIQLRSARLRLGRFRRGNAPAEKTKEVVIPALEKSIKQAETALAAAGSCVELLMGNKHGFQERTRLHQVAAKAVSDCLVPDVGGQIPSPEELTLARFLVLLGVVGDPLRIAP